jgi:hypothetical protein
MKYIFIMLIEVDVYTYTTVNVLGKVEDFHVLS